MDQDETLQDLAPFAGTQTMLILVGLVASGKVIAFDFGMVVRKHGRYNSCSPRLLKHSNITFRNFVDVIKMSLGRDSASRV